MIGLSIDNTCTMKTFLFNNDATTLAVSLGQATYTMLALKIIDCTVVNQLLLAVFGNLDFDRGCG
jgi:hypothetical protein